jgi:hypothetical protein
MLEKNKNTRQTQVWQAVMANIYEIVFLVSFAVAISKTLLIL